MKKRLFIIDENRSGFRDRLLILLESSEKLNVVGIYDDGESAMPEILKKSPELIVMSTDLPFKSGIEIAQSIKSRFPHIEILMISEYEDRDTVHAVFRAGAGGYLLRSESSMELLKGIEELSQGGAPLSRKIARLLIRDLHTNLNSIISNREKQVMQMISAGMTYTEISEALNISKETSRTHIKNIYAKLKVNSKSQAISRAKEERLI